MSYRIRCPHPLASRHHAGLCVFVCVWVILSSVGFRSPRWCCVCVCVCVSCALLLQSVPNCAGPVCVRERVVFVCMCLVCAPRSKLIQQISQTQTQAQTGKTTQSYTRYNEIHRHRHLQGQTQTKATQSEGHKQNKRSTDRLNKIKTYKGSKDVQDKK